MIESDGTYRDVSDLYGITLTAIAVPEPATSALVVLGCALGAALLFRSCRLR